MSLQLPEPQKNHGQTCSPSASPKVSYTPTHTHTHTHTPQASKESQWPWMQKERENALGVCTPFSNYLCPSGERTAICMLAPVSSWLRVARWVNSLCCPVKSAEKLHQVGSHSPCVCMLSCFSRVRLFVTAWTVAHQASLSVGLPRQEYCRGLPCLPPGDLPDPGIKPASLAPPVLAAWVFTTRAHPDKGSFPVTTQLSLPHAGAPNPQGMLTFHHTFLYSSDILSGGVPLPF